MAGQTDSLPAAGSTSILQKLNAWGSNAMPAMGMATLIAALHTRPLQPLPLLFAPALMFSSYVNVAGYAIDSAGMTAAWSGMYVLLALRGRRLAARGKSFWSPASQRTSRRRMETAARRFVSIATIGLGTVNCVAGGVTYGLMGDRVAEAEARKERNRWGDQDEE